MSVQASVTVVFDIPRLLLENVPYRLNIKNVDSDQIFPNDSFALALVITNPIKKERIGIAAITTSTYKGSFYRGFTISQFSLQTKIIEMSITFRKEVFDNMFTIRYSVAKTDKEKKDFFNDATKGIIFERILKLYLPYTITLQATPSIGVIDSKDQVAFGNNLLIDKLGMITCEATNGIPKINPQFINQDILKGAVEKSINTGINSLTWKVLLEDHGKIILCKAGDDMQNITLTVYHYVSEVQTSPPIASRISRKSQIKCISKDGYPVAKMTWAFISGPPEAWKFYQLRDHNITLFINYSAPINSNWSFECRGSNDMPLVVQTYLAASLPNYPIKKLYNFTIIDSEDNVQTSKGGIAALVIILILIIIIVIICALKRSQIMEVLNIQYTRIFKSKTNKNASVSNSKSPMFKYSEGNKGEPQPNGADENPYTDIVGIVQTKGTRDQSLGPIHRV